MSLIKEVFITIIQSFIAFCFINLCLFAFMNIPLVEGFVFLCLIEGVFVGTLSTIIACIFR